MSNSADFVATTNSSSQSLVFESFKLNSQTYPHQGLAPSPVSSATNSEGQKRESPSKRQRSLSHDTLDSSQLQTGHEIPKKTRKNSTRACDSCKKRKLKCDGIQPCTRCTKGRIECTFNEKYTRGVFGAPAIAAAPTTAAVITTPGQENISRAMLDISKLDNSLSVSAMLMDNGSSRYTSREQSVEQEERLQESFLGGSSNLLYSHTAKVQLSQPGDESPREPNKTVSGSDPRISRLEKVRQTDLTDTHDSKSLGNNRSANRVSKSQRRSSHHHFWFPESKPGEIDAKVLALPSKEIALQLVAWYFDNASPTYRILHRPTVESWINCGFYSDNTQSSFAATVLSPIAPVQDATTASIDAVGGKAAAKSSSPNLLHDHSISALIFSVWAMGCQFPVGVCTTSKQRKLLQDRAQQYFLIAMNELDRDKSLEDRLTTLQAKFIMCQYLLTTSQVKASWNLLASVKNIANNLDLNRRNFGYGLSHIKPNDLIYIELRKRVFWAIYTLDAYMCTMLGKTLMLAEEDITVGLPSLTDDCRNLKTADNDDGQEEDEDEIGPSLMYTPIAHAKLSRIIRLTLRKLYSDVAPESQEDVIDDLAKLVDKWESELPTFLRLRSSGGLKLPYSRQLDVVRLAHAHAEILIYRPSLNISDGNASSSAAQRSRKQAQQEKCLDAAISVAKMRGFSELSGSFWFISYIYFCAATVMFVYLAQNHNSTRKKEVLQYSRKLCDVERRLATQSDMAKRYMSALTELWVQVRKLLKRTESETVLKSDSLTYQDPMGATLNDNRNKDKTPGPNTETLNSVTGEIMSDYHPHNSLQVDVHELELVLGNAVNTFGLNNPSTASSFETGEDAQLDMEANNRYNFQGAYAPILYDSGIFPDPSIVERTTDRAQYQNGMEDSGNYDLLLDNNMSANDLSDILFGDILGNLAQSFQGFDSAASAGFGSNS